ncbi:GMC family oxidoreductase N-terminal domain-containing protein [Pendulispora albinea]|uniref:GMC family oxidoreductase n=1 Tax=Pendulispora albinea TaxID=2741071 RepID=A0ABZ2MCJ0_9BACT
MVRGVELRLAEKSFVTRGRDLRADLALDAGAVVVGMGAGGSIALRELARAGVDVVGLEEGGYHTAADFNQREEQMLALLFQEMGGRTTEDMAIRVLQGRGVGGSTIHNTNLCKRIPDPILNAWSERLGLHDLRPEALAPVFAQIESELGVSTMGPSDRNANNEVLRIGIEKLGWRGGPLQHNRIGCQRSGFCELGCSYDAKQNALKVVLPQAAAAGAHVYADIKVTEIQVDGGAVTGVEGVALDERGAMIAHVRIRTRVVVLAGSATGSAALALASGLPDPHDQLGRGLHLHPAALVAGVFDRELDGFDGIPQSYECTEHLSFEPGSDRRVWIVPAFGHPIATAALLPGFGAAHMRAMRAYRKLAVLTAMVHDESEGRVLLRDGRNGGRPQLRYELGESDRVQLAKGIVACGRILFAAGAKEVVVPAVFPLRTRDARELDRVDMAFVRPHHLPLSAVHPMGSMRLGTDPARSVVGPTGEHHQVRGLFVADGSLFPTSIGGPPQIGIYALALHLSRHMVARAKG